MLEAWCPSILRLARRISSRALFVGVLLLLTSLFTIEGVAQVPPKLTVEVTVGDHRLTFTWEAPSGTVTHYQTRSGGSWVSIGTNTSNIRSGLPNETAHVFQFRAVNADGAGPQTLARGTPMIPAPTELTATEGDGQVELSWTKPSPLYPPTGRDAVTRYEYTTNDGTDWVSTGDDSTSYTVTKLTNGTEYTFKVRAIRAYAVYQEPGANSEAASKTPNISAPKNLTATPGAGQVSLSWTAVSGVTTITGYQYQQDSGPWKDTSTTTSHTVTKLTGGVSYSFKVRAYGAGGPGTASGEVSEIPEASATPPPPQNPSDNAPPPGDDNAPPPSGTVPGPPADAQVDIVEDRATNTAQATLTWSPPSNAANTEDNPIMYAYRYRASPWTPWISMNGSGPPYTVTGLPSGKKYEFQIGAYYMASGISSLSSNNASIAAVQSVSTPKRRIIKQCPIGWTRGSVFGNTKKALIYELKVEVDATNRTSIYQLKSVAIYVHPDENLETLDGWTLKVGTLYNQFGKELKLTAENSVIDEHNFAHIENPDETPIPMSTLGYIGQSLPSFDYRLYDGGGVRVDFGISCYKGGGLTWRLWNTKDPRLLRVLPLAGGEASLSVQMENLNWQTPFFRSEWTAAVMPDLPDAPAAPSQMKGNMVGTWADLKKQ